MPCSIPVYAAADVQGAKDARLANVLNNEMQTLPDWPTIMSSERTKNN